MPPRKKHKAAEAPEAENGHASPDTPAPRDSATKPDTGYDLVADPWTDEQETALLKAIIKWKPVGIHKHFRMIAISEFMKSQGYAPSHAEHTRIPGIWKKLSTLYNLPALDEREDSLITDIADDSDPPNERYCSFQLPDEEYGDMMFDRRLATDGSESPVTTGRAESRRGSLVDTDEARSSPAQSRGRKSNRRGRPSTRGTRSKRLREETRKEPATGDDEDGNSDDTGANDNDEAEDDASDAAEDDSDAEEEAEEDEEGGEDDGEEEAGEAGEDDDDDEAGDSPATRSTRANTTRSKQKDKGAAAGTRRTGRRR